MNRTHLPHRETDGLSNRTSPSLLSLEDRVKRIEEMMGIYDFSAEGLDAFFNSESGKAEYRAALVQLSVYHNKKPFERFLEKTNGRVPRNNEG